MNITFKGKKKTYNLSSDERQFVLSEVMAIQTGKNKGEETYRPLGCYCQIEHVFKRLLHLEINDSLAETFGQLLKAITETKAWIDALVLEKPEPPKDAT